MAAPLGQPQNRRACGSPSTNASFLIPLTWPTEWYGRRPPPTIIAHTPRDRSRAVVGCGCTTHPPHAALPPWPNTFTYSYKGVGSVPTHHHRPPLHTRTRTTRTSHRVCDFANARRAVAAAGTCMTALTWRVERTYQRRKRNLIRGTPWLRAPVERASVCQLRARHRQRFAPFRLHTTPFPKPAPRARLLEHHPHTRRGRPWFDAHSRSSLLFGRS